MPLELISKIKALKDGAYGNFHILAETRRLYISTPLVFNNSYGAQIPFNRSTNNDPHQI